MRGQNIEFAQVGSQLENGFDLGGARIYPFSTGLAITPPAYYSDYIGNPSGIPVTPPNAALAGTAGAPTSSALNAMANPLGKSSPLLWIVLGLFGAVAAMHALHYTEKRG